MDSEKLKKAMDLNEKIEDLNEKLKILEMLEISKNRISIGDYYTKVNLTDTQKNIVMAVVKTTTEQELQKLQAEFDEL